MSALDEHLHAPWKPGETMSTPGRRESLRHRGLPTWRIVRYADLCRRRHKSAYAELRIMPTVLPDSMVRAASGFPLSA